MIEPEDGAQSEVERLRSRVAVLERELAGYRQSRGEPGNHASEVFLTPEDIPNFFGLLKPSGEVERVNRQLWEFFGGTAETIHEWGAHPEIHHPEDRARIVAEFAAGVGSGQPFVCTYRGRRFDGAYRWLECEQKPLRDRDGRIYRWCVIMRDIDDLVRATQALREKENDLRLIIDTIPGLICLFSPDGVLDGANQQLIDYVGQPIEVTKNWGTNGIVHPDDVPGTTELFMHSIRTGEPYDFEIRIRRFDGEYRYFKIRGRPHRDSQGRIVRWYGLLVDSHERKLAEDALRASELEQRLIIDTIPGLICLFTPDGALEGVSQQMTDYVGQPVEVTKHWAANGIVHPDDVPTTSELFMHSIRTGEPYDFEIRIRRFDGEYRYFKIRGRPHRNEQGRIVRWYGLLIDSHERKQAEDALRASELEQRQIINTIPGLICLFTPDGQLEGANQQFLGYLQQTSEQLSDWSTNGTVHSEDLARTVDAFGRSIKSGEPYDFELRLRRFDGVYRWFQARGQAAQDSQGGISRWYGLLTDIHDRKLAEDELRRREYYLAMGERVSLTGSYAWEMATDEITCSEQLLRIHEFDDPSKVTAAAMRARIHPDDLSILESTRAEVENGRGNPEYEIRLLMPDGRVKHVRAFAEVVQGADGQMICIGAVQDVSRRRLAEDSLDKVRSDLAHLSRLTTLGSLTASIAHEVNQPLTGITTNANTCARLLSVDPPNVAGALETVRRTIRDATRAAEIVARLRALFSGRTAKNREVDLNEAATEVLALMSGDLQRDRVQVQTHFATELPTVTADRVQLQQVIMNLLKNAADAMSGLEDRQRLAILETKKEGDEAVRLSVRDSGVGFVTDSAEQMFQAFYSTKNTGMGVGLSVSRSIIESHGGKIWAERPEGGGATFVFSIPIATSADEAPPMIS